MITTIEPNSDLPIMRVTRSGVTMLDVAELKSENESFDDFVWCVLDGLVTQCRYDDSDGTDYLCLYFCRDEDREQLRAELRVIENAVGTT